MFFDTRKKNCMSLFLHVNLMTDSFHVLPRLFTDEAQVGEFHSNDGSKALVSIFGVFF